MHNNNYGYYLEHMGVIGMRWGKRKVKTATSPKPKSKKSDTPKKIDYEKTKNQLGSASTAVGEAKKIESTLRESKIKKQKKEIMRTDLSTISDADLKRIVARMTSEKQYNALQAEKISVGKNHIKDILETTGTVIAVTTSAVGLLAALDKMVGEKKKVA